GALDGRRHRRGVDPRQSAVRDGCRPLQGNLPRTDRWRRLRHVQDDLSPRRWAAAWRALHRNGRDRTRARWTGRARPGWRPRLLFAHSFQLSHPGGVLQGSVVQRRQQARARPWHDRRCAERGVNAMANATDPAADAQDDLTRRLKRLGLSSRDDGWTDRYLL